MKILFSVFVNFSNANLIDEEPCHGLTFTEITGEACMEIINSTFGVTADNVNKIFKELDQDKNQIISKYEATTVGTSLLTRQIHKQDI